MVYVYDCVQMLSKAVGVKREEEFYNVGTEMPVISQVAVWKLQIGNVGYLIFSSLDTGITTREFYKKRVLRIILEYWSVLIVCWIVDVTKYLHTGGRSEGAWSI